MTRTLSSYVQRHPECITSSLQKLSCTSQGITDVDIHPAVLAMLVKEAPAEVTHAAAGFWSAHASATVGVLESTTQRRWRQQDVGHAGAPREEEYFNVAVALTLDTVLLSRNRLTSLLGVIQFRNVVRLSLLGNHIRRVEDCEPLALLPRLMFLSLEYNPVAALPHYRAHLLRITAWPQPLSLTSCRLRRLDGREVSAGEVAHAMRCLQREQMLLPELLHRQRLLCFARDALHRQRLHSELRRRGVLFAEHFVSCTVAKLLLYGTDSALTGLDDSAATHATRRLVQRIACTSRRGSAALDHLSDGGAASHAHDHRGDRDGHLSVSLTYLTTLTESTSSTSDDDSATAQVDDTRGSAAAQATGVTATTSMLDEVKEALLSQGTLSWGRLSLRNAQQALDEDICSEWSGDQFRRALAALDVQLCAHLLRLARVLGHSLSSHAVDELCLRWLRDSAVFVPPQEATVNCTGRRARQVPRTLQPAQVSRHAAPKSTNLPRSAYFSADSSHRQVTDGDTSDVTMTTVDATTSPPQASLLSNIVSPAQVLPSPPSSIAPTNTLRDGAVAQNEAAAIIVCPAGQDDVPSEPRPRPPLASHRHTRDGGLSGMQMSMPEEDETVEGAVVTAVTLRRVWRRWRDALRRRRQYVVCTHYVCERARNITARATVSSPHDVPIIFAGLPYTERKRVFFLHWWHHARDRRAACLLRTHHLMRVWRQETALCVRRRGELGRGLQLRAAWRRWRRAMVAKVYRQLSLTSAATLVDASSAADAANGNACVSQGDACVHRGGGSPLTMSSGRAHEEPGLSSHPPTSSPRSVTTSRVEAHPIRVRTGSCRVVPLTPHPTVISRDTLKSEAVKVNRCAASTHRRGTEAEASGRVSHEQCEDHETCMASCSATGATREERQTGELVELRHRFAAMQAERALLVHRVIDLQMCVEEQKLLRRQAEDTVAQLRHVVAEAEAREKRATEAQQGSEVEVGRLRRCIEALRQERRELLEQILE